VLIDPRIFDSFFCRRYRRTAPPCSGFLDSPNPFFVFLRERSVAVGLDETKIDHLDQTLIAGCAVRNMRFVNKVGCEMDHRCAASAGVDDTRPALNLEVFWLPELSEEN